MPSLVQKPWSSKDVTNNPTPLPLDTPSLSGALGNETDPLEIKEECVQCNGGKSLEDWDSYIPSFTKFMHNHRLHQVILLGTKCFLVSQKCRLEIPSHLSDGTDEDLRILPAPDPPIEQDDSNTMSVAVGNDFVEDTIFYQLQDIISKLDIKIRLCIRDSLIRLAQSATQRHYASDTNSTNKSSRDELEVEAREESNKQNRYVRMPDVETETNPIDRTVAHLLFHSPVELTHNYSDKLESPVSTKVQCESKAGNLVNFPYPTRTRKTINNFLTLG
ncbi:protein LNK2-like [Vigna angularis]|uniref:protein LNK2-like n=1 Tax=Phaseolus angularis TaxID=3914 RepID=UPI0022B4CDF3|nr:protein LNK2-like [Vigna angularis]